MTELGRAVRESYKKFRHVKLQGKAKKLSFGYEVRKQTYHAGFIAGVVWIVTQMKHMPWYPEDKHCQCLTCIKLHRMGL